MACPRKNIIEGSKVVNTFVVIYMTNFPRISRWSSISIYGWQLAFEFYDHWNSVTTATHAAHRRVFGSGYTPSLSVSSITDKLIWITLSKSDRPTHCDFQKRRRRLNLSLLDIKVGLIRSRSEESKIFHSYIDRFAPRFIHLNTVNMTSLKRSLQSDPYASNISSKVFVRSTKSGKVQKIVRELYLRQDIPCSSKLCTTCLETAPRDASGVCKLIQDQSFYMH